jgi:ketosteroid isomerase-like protein
MTADDSEIEALLASGVDACQARDIDQLMELYSRITAYFDVVPPPLFFNGSDNVRTNFIRWFDEYDGAIGLDRHDLNIATSADVAFAHMLHLDSGTRKNALEGMCSASRAV